ncbi:uroporphyrinogen decarboxylase [Magnetococcus marinus MC-1]|uniref:Uroporphyrinogen decarboxylase n=1 Tax=Magnetococcus marinus (strain ATCC BAA-1437 / JCM 17883 / MC-1) TaxID=156889 RepID=DCUP_MAGMM|nr:uroporphyrinogen decarboxylase [Magnetococcus marinus]A0L3L1.1 RecName: Full=Uroporphyrinogen decarboxylase; Short=UPD; Short=URO-D [Magnetococcus marinus MC-1]ABK42554.1 uroporphyrinogen decarboxylase [Magnetococcus marinus MC-1]
MKSKHRFIQACFRQPVDRTPIWLMRQAGRYLPEYRKTRAQAGDFMALCKNTELATEVTMQPIRRYGLDAAILFSDILVIPEAMGMDVRFATGEGPLLDPPVRVHGDIEKLIHTDPEDSLDYVMRAVASIRKALNEEIPLIGFSGSPWTLATYMVEGGSSKTFGLVKGMLYDAPESMHLLLDKLADMVAAYLNAQIRHGAQAVQIFDTWGGVLSQPTFREFSLRSMKAVVDRLDRTNSAGERIPVILFAKGCNAMVEDIAQSGCDVVGLDWTSEIGPLRERIGHKVALQGNMDPALLYASPERIAQGAREVLQAFGPHPGHIFNLGHGMAPDMSPDHVEALVRAVKEEGLKIHQGVA